MLQAVRNDEEASKFRTKLTLEGWGVTGETCPQEGCSNCLMSPKDKSYSLCTKHDQIHQIDAPNSEMTSSNIDKDNESKIRIERREQSSRASQLIGQKMLQRWALLNEHCPLETCYAVPLIRNPDTKQMFCVICENYILTEKEELERKQKANKQLDVQQHTKVVEETTADATVTSKPAHLPAISQPIQQVEQQKRQKVNGKQYLSKSNNSDTTDCFSSNEVVETLITKMNELNDKVKDCSDSDELSALFKLIKQCAGAIQACVEAGKACDKSNYAF